MNHRSLRGDSHPEHTVYRDDGCEHHPRCLTCVFPFCVHDNPVAFAALRSSAAGRAVEARRLRGEGLVVAEVAARLGVSGRQVQRMVHWRPAMRSI